MGKCFKLLSVFRSQFYWRVGSWWLLHTVDTFSPSQHDAQPNIWSKFILLHVWLWASDKHKQQQKPYFNSMYCAQTETQDTHHVLRVNMVLLCIHYKGCRCTVNVNYPVNWWRPWFVRVANEVKHLCCYNLQCKMKPFYYITTNHFICVIFRYVDYNTRMVPAKDSWRPIKLF